MSTEFRCYHCGTTIPPSSQSSLGRRDQCTQCRRDLHCCRNCRHYSPTSYNECREPNADRVVDKEQSNFCDFFAPGGDGKGQGSETGAIRKKLDDLFK